MVSVRYIDAIIYYLLFAYALISGISRGGVNTTIILLSLFAVIRYICKPFTFQVDIAIARGMMVLLAALLLSIAFSGHILVSVELLALTILKIFPFFIVLAFVKDRKMVDTIVLFMTGSLLLGSLVAIWQGIHGAGRATSFLGIMDFAGVIGLVFPILFVYGFEYKGKKRWHNGFFMATAGVTAIALVFNGTRSIWISIFVTIFLYTILNIRRNKKVIIAFSLIMLISIGVGLTNRYVSEKASSIIDTKVNISNVQRLNMWKYAWNIFLNHPILGVGFGCLPHGDDFLKGVPQPMMETIKGDHIHNNFLQMLAENGIIGFSAFCYLFATILLSAWKKMQSKTSRTWGTIAFLCTIDFLVHGFFDYTIKLAIAMYTYWFILGLAFVRFRIEKEDTI